MASPSYFHVGIVVPDLHKAILHYERLLGMTFTPPAHVPNPRLEDPAPHEQIVHVAFSEQGPPYLELIEADGDGIFSAEHQGKLLYLGFWEPDMAGRMRTLEAEGIGVAAASRSGPGAVPDWIVTEPDELGIRIEYVDVADKEAIESWIATGQFPGAEGPAPEKE